MRKLLETKPCSRNLIKEVNTWEVPFVRYSGLFLKWTREKLIQMDQRTRKLMTIHKVLHLRDDIDRLYGSRKKGGRELTSIKDSIDASIQGLKEYIKKSKERLSTTVCNSTDNIRTNKTTMKTSKKEMRIKTVVWIFQLINLQKLR